MLEPEHADSLRAVHSSLPHFPLWSWKDTQRPKKSKFFDGLVARKVAEHWLNTEGEFFHLHV